MKQDYTDITIVLDRSGSMQSIKSDMEGGFNTFIDGQKKVPGECRVSLAQFDTVYESVYDGKPITEVPKLELLPRGSTALLDAIGRTINQTGARLKDMPEDQRPAHIIFLIITDGLENASHEFTHDKVKEMISHQQDTYKWEFVFLGANQDAIATGTAMNIPGSNVMTYASNTRGVRSSYAALHANTTRIRNGDKSQWFDQKDRDEQKQAGATS